LGSWRTTKKPASNNQMACNSPLSPLCTQECSSFSIRLGCCGALADTPQLQSAGSFVSWCLLIYFFMPVLIVVLRTSTWVWVSMVLLFAIILNEIFQSTIEDVRPPGACVGSGNTCGMPSGHCSTTWTVLTFLVLVWCREFQYHYRLAGAMRVLKTPAGALRASMRVFLVVVTLMMPWARIVVYAHYPVQAAVGCVDGLVVGSLWFLLALRLNPVLGPRLERCYIRDDFALAELASSDVVAAARAYPEESLL
jgi:membrane-associated phospholipid phosphatase